MALCFVLVMAIIFTDRGAGINGGTVALAEIIPLFATLLGGRRVGFGWMLVTLLVAEEREVVRDERQGIVDLVRGGFRHAEPLVARSLQRLLRKCDTAVTGTGEQALHRIENGPELDWILCDLMMPGLSGMDVYAKLADERPDLAKRMVFITGGAFTDSARDFRNTVKNPFLEKPVDAAQLLSLIGQPANSRRP